MVIKQLLFHVEHCYTKTNKNQSRRQETKNGWSPYGICISFPSKSHLGMYLRHKRMFIKKNPSPFVYFHHNTPQMKRNGLIRRWEKSSSGHHWPIYYRIKIGECMSQITLAIWTTKWSGFVQNTHSKMKYVSKAILFWKCFFLCVWWK